MLKHHSRRVRVVTLAALLFGQGCVSSTYDTTSQSVTTTAETETTCADDGQAKIKRKLELRKIKLEADIDTDESTIRVNDGDIAANSASITALTEFIKLVNDGRNYPPTDPAQESMPGKKNLQDLLDDVGKFPATAVGKFGLYSLMAALEALTLRAGGKFIVRKLCMQTAVRQAEKLAVAQAVKMANAKALGMFGKFARKFGRVRLVVGGIGAIAVPMKHKWDQNGDTWETWVPVIGTMKIGLEDVGDAFTAYVKADEVRKYLQAQIALIDDEQKTTQAEIKEKAADSAAKEAANVVLAQKIKAMKAELAKINAALAKLGGNVCAACDGEVLVASEPVEGAPDAGVRDGYTYDGSSQEESDYSSWSVDELLAEISLDDAEASVGDSAEALIYDELEMCDADDQCTPL